LHTFIYFNQFQKKIELPINDITHGDIAILTGWGLTAYPFSGTSDRLQKISVSILDHEECSRYYPFRLEKEQLCTFNKKKSGACHVSFESILKILVQIK
jgi:hypothetical protein